MLLNKGQKKKKTQRLVRHRVRWRQAQAGQALLGSLVGCGQWSLPSGIVKMNKVPIIPKLGEHLIMVSVHISCSGGERSEQGSESRRYGRSYLGPDHSISRRSPQPYPGSPVSWAWACLAQAASNMQHPFLVPVGLEGRLTGLWG